MVFNIFKQYRNLRQLVARYMQTYREIKRVVYSVDPILARWTTISLWIGAVWNTVSQLVWIILFGVVAQSLADGALTKGKFSYMVVASVFVLVMSYRWIGYWIEAYMEYRGSKFQARLRNLLEQRFVNHMVSLDLGTLSDPGFIELKEKADRRGSSAIESIWESRQNMLNAVTGIIVSFGLILFLSPLMIVLLSVPVVPYTIRALVIERKRRKLWEDQRLTDRQVSEHKYYLIGRQSIVQLKLFRFVEFVYERFIGLQDKLLKENIRMERYNFFSSLAVEGVSFIVVVVAGFYLSGKVVEGEIPITKLFIIIGSIRNFSGSLRQFAGQIARFHRLQDDYRYLATFFESKSRIDENKTYPLKLTSPPVIDFVDVDFTYPGRNHPALRQCSLTILPCEKVALVGRNGSGKTTLGRLLTKVYLPNEGQVRVNGILLSSISQESWLNQVLYVIQDSGLPDFTIEMAITGTMPDRIDRQRLRQATRLTSADEFIDELSLKYETQIGENWPGGVGFSSGQMQRLVLSASFYRLLDPDVHVAFLDEPMSHCDIEVREQFYRSLRGLKDKTVIVVAHDPMCLPFFDRVILLKDGTVDGELTTPEEIDNYRATLLMQLTA